jgi:hypothetical protein
MKLQELYNAKRIEELKAECPEGVDPQNYAEMILVFEEMESGNSGTVEGFIEAYDKEMAEFGKIRILG